MADDFFRLGQAPLVDPDGGAAPSSHGGVLRKHLRSLPRFAVASGRVSSDDGRPDRGPDDNQWTVLGWPDDISTIASPAQPENGKLIIYYSTVFPNYVSRRVAYLSRTFFGCECLAVLLE